MNECKAIREALLNHRESLVSLLRRTQFLAIAAGNHRVCRWADHELNGYPDDTALPEYRQILSQSFVKLQGNQVVIDAILVPHDFIPGWLREETTHSQMRNPIADYLPYLAGKHDDELRECWPRQLVAQMNAETRPFIPAMKCLEGWKTVHRAEICEMVASCRDELLVALSELEFGFGQNLAAIDSVPVRPLGRMAMAGAERRTA